MKIALIVSILALAGCMGRNTHTDSNLSDKPSRPLLIRMAYPDDAETEPY